MIKNIIVFSSSPSEIRDVLSKHLRKRPPRGRITENQFLIYRRITNSNSRAMIMFCIHGKITPIKSGTELSYFIRPTFPALLLACLFLYGFIYSSVYSLLHHSLNIYFGGIVGIAGLYFTILFWQMFECKSIFSAYLLQEVNRITGDSSPS